MTYHKNNINELFNDFYKYVNDIIIDIHENPSNILSTILDPY